MGRLISTGLALSAALALSLPAVAGEAPGAPQIGDVVNGAKLVKRAKVDGNWLNAYSSQQCLVGLKKGKAKFPKVKSKSPLDRWDALAFIRARNTTLEELFPDADHALITWGELDKFAEERLTKASLKPKKGDKKRTLFAVYKLGDKTPAEIKRVREKDHKTRDKLKPGAKVGYAVFMKLPGLRDGKHEVAIAVDNEVVIQGIRVRAADGTIAKDLDSAAQRFIGRGARGQYEPLKAGGKGKAVRELQTALTGAYLKAMEAVYMYEVREREYFAFDEG